MNPNDLLGRFSAALVKKIGSQRHSLWFEGNTSFVLVGRDLMVVVSNESFQKWLEQTFGNDVRGAAAEVSGSEWTVRFVVECAAVHGSSETPPQVIPATSTATIFGDEILIPPPSRPTKKKTNDEGQPAPRSTRRWKLLHDFVVGSTNRVAYAAAQSIVDDPADSANPLVLFGPVGTGKTHLLEGIYAGLRKQHPDLRPVLITAEDFTTRFVQACRFDRQSQFRRQFRECSAFLLDDLNFLANKPRSQEELMHTIDALIAEGHQVVVTTDCHPKLADELLPELVDRLQAGATWPLQPPDESTRLDILRKKAGNSSPVIPEAILKEMSKNIRGNVRELEGAVLSLRHYAKVTGRAVDTAMLREALGDLLRHAVRPTTIKNVDEAVCAVLRLNPNALQTKGRSWAVSHPRMVAVYLCRKHTTATYGEISKHFAAKTHSTAVASEKKVRAWLDKKESLQIGDRTWDIAELIERIERELQK
jgi:chromosomal replication initiator protein